MEGEWIPAELVNANNALSPGSSYQGHVNDEKEREQMFVLSIPICLMHVHDSTTTFLSLFQHADDRNAALLVIQRNF